MTGSQGKMGLRAILDREIILEIVHGLRLNTGTAVMQRDGKPRIRHLENRSGEHSYLTLAAVLLLPKPIRELNKTLNGKAVQLQNEQFSISSIYFSLMEVDEHAIIIAPTEIVLENADHSVQRIHFAKRLHEVFNLWKAAENTTATREAKWLHLHRVAVEDGDLGNLKDAANGLRKLTGNTADPVLYLQKMMHLPIDNELSSELGPTTTEEVENRSALEIKTEIIRQWRYLAVRGAAGEKFRKDVRDAYKSTCLFSGLHLPATAYSSIPGVEAAHILPWALHHINHVQNGICIDKLCHWALDSGILRLEYKQGDGGYWLTIPDRFLRLHQQQGLNLAYFLGMQGRIPTDRLPANTQLWPSPEFLVRANAFWPD